MKSRSVLGATTLAVALLGSLTACGGTDPATPSVAEDCTPAHDGLETIESGIVTVATYVSPPYSVLDRAGSDVGGVDGELIRRIAELECLEVQANPVAGAALIETISSGRADVGIGGIYFTQERADTLSLSDTLYRDGMALLSTDGDATLADLDGKQVGVIQGYLWNEDLQNALGTENVTTYQDADTMLADLSAGRLQAGVLTSAEAAFRAEQSGDEFQVEQFEATDEVAASTAPGEVVLASPQDATALTEAFDADIQQLIEDGTVADILTENGIDADLVGAGS